MEGRPFENGRVNFMLLDKVVNWARALAPLVLIISATAALFLGIAGMGEWAAACGSILALWLGQKGYRALKAKKQ